MATAAAAAFLIPSKIPMNVLNRVVDVVVGARSCTDCGCAVWLEEGGGSLIFIIIVYQVPVHIYITGSIIGDWRGRRLVFSSHFSESY